jgi:hypothetical protein
VKWVNLDKFFSEENYGKLIDRLNTVMSNLTMANLGAEIRTVTIPAASTISLNHNLKVTPKYKIILRHIGPQELDDSSTPWTDSAIYLRNRDATTEITATIAILRG